MCDILYDFYERNGLEHCCALESRIGGNYNTEEQKEWLERFGDIWDRVEQREINKGKKWNLNKNGNYLNKTSSDKQNKVLCLELIGMC